MLIDAYDLSIVVGRLRALFASQPSNPSNEHSDQPANQQTPDTRALSSLADMLGELSISHTSFISYSINLSVLVEFDVR